MCLESVVLDTYSDLSHCPQLGVVDAIAAIRMIGSALRYMYS